MPRIRLTKSAIDALPTPKSDVVYWDAASPGFGVKVTPKSRRPKAAKCLSFYTAPAVPAPDCASTPSGPTGA
jgi:hypothetical protein